VKPAEVQWLLLRAKRRALDGPGFQSPAVRLARIIWQMRQFLLAGKAQKKRQRKRYANPRTYDRIYSYAIEHCEKRTKELLPIISMTDLSKELAKVEKTDFGIESAEKVVLEAYCRIFDRNVKAINRKKLDANHAEPESGRAVYNEIEAMTKERRNCKLPWESTVYTVLGRLGLPTGQGKRGPARGSRQKKLPKNRPK
jgi:hypothetical protein